MDGSPKTANSVIINLHHYSMEVSGQPSTVNFKISSSAFSRRNKLIQVWSNMKPRQFSFLGEASL